MNNQDEIFLKKLMATFKVEADEHIKIISSGLLELEKENRTREKEKIIETIFREAHSFKGAARAVSLTHVEVICRCLESVFDAWKRHKTDPTQEAFDAIHKALNFLIRFLIEAEKPSLNNALFNTEMLEIQNLLEPFWNLSKDSALEEKTGPAILNAELPATSETFHYAGTSAKEKTALTETIRIPSRKLDSLFLKTEEVYSSKLSLGNSLEEMNKILSSFGELKKEKNKIAGVVRTIDRDLKYNSNGNGNGAKKNRSVLKLIEYLDWNESYTKTIERQLITIADSLKQNYHTVDVTTTNLLEEMKNVLMLPFSSLTEILPGVVRELSHEQKKDVSLNVRGAEIEIDKRILEELKDPFMHLVRNCIDHGIELPVERKRKGKNSKGLVAIDIAQKESGKVEINISDDGKGIETDKICASAVKQKLISENDLNAMTEQQILSLVFHSGISSSAIITDISGRGLGLAIVREKVEKLGGSVSVKSHTGAGTSFQIILPLTLATIRGILIRAGEQLFVIPTANVKRVVRIKDAEIKTVENRDTIQLGEKVFSLVRLTDVLGLKQMESESRQSNIHLVIIISVNENDIALAVDEILEENEVLIKNLGKQLEKVENISGVTVLGNGKVVPVLNIFELIKSCIKTSPVKSISKPEEEEISKRKSVMVAEDSITARTLLKNILEAAGYEVTTAVDGLDAFTQMKTNSFDLVISDVDMPRMSGFDLTLKIRGEKKFSNTPVILVTALESRNDRERGIDVGANAYIVKSSFDQQNLLEVVRQLC